MMLMISCNMNRRVLLSIILFVTIIGIGVLFFYHFRNSYNHYVVSTEKWNRIKESRVEDSSFLLTSFKFQDTSLLFIDLCLIDLFIINHLM